MTMIGNQPAPTQLYIDGEWRDAADGQRIDVVDPATEQVIATVPRATAGDVEDALAATATGFDRWRATGAWERSAALRRMAGIIRDEVDRYAAVMTAEQGKPLGAWVSNTPVGCLVVWCWFGRIGHVFR